MGPKLELCLTVRGYIVVGNEMIQINNVLNGPQRVFIPVLGGFIKGVGPAEGLDAQINPSSSDGLLVRNHFSFVAEDALCRRRTCQQT